MRVHLQYGKDGLDVEVPGSDVTVFRPRFQAGLADEKEAFRMAVRRPVGSLPLKELVASTDRVAVVIPDITRPFPSERVLPWLFGELSHVPASHFTVISGTGSHRANTREEIVSMVGTEVAGKYRLVNHSAYDRDTLAPAGRTPDNHTVLLNREYVAADKRIILGFVEPHFFAGFSGGYKAVFPGLADIDSIMHYHRASVIADPRSTWGVLEANPTQKQIRANGSLLTVDFCGNVTLNSRHEITGFFCGEVMAAHEKACAFVESMAAVQSERTYPIVITTNSGYPLDQNLYQTVKGMSAANEIIEEGGLIVTVSRCEDGFPEHGNFRRLLLEHDSPEKLLKMIETPGFNMHDQWEAQKLGMILINARVALYSEIPDAEVRRIGLEPIGDIDAFLAAQVHGQGKRTPIAVLPEGPMCIPRFGRPAS